MECAGKSRDTNGLPVCFAFAVESISRPRRMVYGCRVKGRSGKHDAERTQHECENDQWYRGKTVGRHLYPFVAAADACPLSTEYSIRQKSTAAKDY